MSDKRWPHKLETSSFIDLIEKARQQGAFLDHALAKQNALKAAFGQDHRSVLLELNQRKDLLKRAGVLK
ncbi:MULTISPECIES: hypothetical protein [unclassified Rhizobium]|uniref:hypothetical protein n=1 Tax=Rhizobium sp. PP-CC-3G-465 TaxID=2135648 RepID=UPI000DA23E65